MNSRKISSPEGIAETVWNKESEITLGYPLRHFLI